MTLISVSDYFTAVEYTDQFPRDTDEASLGTENAFVWFLGLEQTYRPPFEAEVDTVYAGVELLADPPIRGDAMADWYMKQGDTAPHLRAVLTQNSQAVNLSGATVDFRMWRNGTIVVDDSATVDSAQTGEVSYEWSTGDTDSVGTHEAAFIVSWLSGDTQTFPGKGNMIIEVQPAVS